MKAIAVLRVSTESQQIDDQREELYSFIKSQGYSEIIPIEAIGASAVKLDAKYMEMAQKVKDTILSDKDIDAVFVWELSRLGRNEVILMDFKEFFIKYHIQFICKNPYMKLLEEDGSVNAGMELAFSLFATMAKQEAQEKKARFKRAKSAMLKKGKYIGGNIRKYGYKVVDGYFVEDEEEGGIVRLIFNLYSTGEYSSYTLSKELKERGYDMDDRKIVGILSSVAYVGDEVSESGMHYPQIIARDIFDRCAEIRQSNRLSMKRGERLCLGAKLVKCPVCGATCTSNSKHYVCSRHAHHGPCTNGFALRQYVVDDLLWRVAYPLHMDYLMELTEGKKEEYRKSLKVVEEKIAEANRKMENYDAKKARILDTFMEGLIDRKNRDLRLLKVADEVRVQQGLISSLQAKREAILGMLEDHREDDFETFLTAYENMELESKYEIIHKHIESLVATQESFGRRDPRTTRPNAVRIKVKAITGETWTFMYVPKFYEGSNLYIQSGKKWIPDYVTPVR